MSKDKTVKAIKLETPKHKEEFSLAESGMYRPWRVDLKIDIHAGDVEPKIYTIYCRAPNVATMQITAQETFTAWEHLLQGKSNMDYPQLSEREDSEIEVITEEEYMEAWKEAQYYPHVKFGMKENPTAFHIYKPDVSNTSGLVLSGNSSIIVP